MHCTQNTLVAVVGGYKHQAMTLRLAGDKVVLYRVRILGTQDTLLDSNGSHYFYQCYIQGFIDLIIGESRSLYWECNLHHVAVNMESLQLITGTRKKRTLDFLF
ncbi:unnamed protein product [Lactuca saligna]|uniref:pectinesterase n=1 Tax=Lactuca saligna TaxID=75948 RepID=A0AA35V195_LACSI|nr:unnamed protein product [Lactuca saligna]